MKKFCRTKSKNKVNKKAAEQVFLNYAKGILSTEEFWALYVADESLRNALIYDKYRFRKIKWTDSAGNLLYTKLNDRIYELNPDTLPEVFDINNSEHRYQLFIMVNRYLSARKIELAEAEYNNDVKEYLFLHKILPDWVGVNNVTFLHDLTASVPANLTKEEQLKWGEAKVKELFKCKDKKPVWIQAPEWPVIDGRPLIFSHQRTEENGSVRYYFYDELTNKEEIIEQCE